MERIENINPSRVLWCCADRGISIDQMARDVGIAESTIRKFVDDEVNLTFRQLQRIANYFGRGVLFFLEPEDVDAESAHTPQFRTLASMKPDLSPKVRSIIKHAERQRDLYRSLIAEMRIDAPDFDPPSVVGRSVESAAATVRDWLGITNQRSFDSYRKLVESRGILVFRTNGYAGKWQVPKSNPILGFTIYDPELPVIVVKKQNAESRQTFTLMHELGHVILHRDSYIDDIYDVYAEAGRESEANQFAGLVLVPDHLLRQVDVGLKPDSVSDYDEWLDPHKQAWGVSSDVILIRLANTGLLPRTSYTEYRHWRDSRKYPEPDFAPRLYRHREPWHIFGDNFVRTVLDAQSARHISLVKAARYLDGLNLKDFHKLERAVDGV